MRISALIIVLLLSFHAQKTQGQNIYNLVPNGDFDKIDSCFFWYGAIWKIDQWNAAVHFPDTTSSTDYYNICQYSPPMPTPPIPKSIIGESIGCIGLLLKTGFPDIREYAQVKLTESLEADTNYFVSLKVKPFHSLTNPFGPDGLFVNRLELVISKSELYAPMVPNFYTNRINTTPSLVYNGDFLNDTASWTKLNFSYKAKGGEEWLVIGNFSHDQLIGTQPINNTGNFSQAYYLIDDVRLYKDTNAIKQQLKPILPNVISPNQDGTNEFFTIENLPENNTLEVYNRWGGLVFKQAPYQNNWPGNTPNGNPLAVGVYFAILTYQDPTGQLQQKKQTVHVVR